MLRIENLNKAYGQRIVLQQLSLSVGNGQIYGLLGPNGAGKTTTINILCNLLQADSGSVSIDGQPVSERTKRLLGVSPQETLVYQYLTCAENLAFFATLYGLRGRRRQEQVQHCLQVMGLVDRADSLAKTLSGGMQRRLSIAIALVHRPKLLILDEPTTGLDVEARFELWDLIRQLQQQGITLLLTTHLLDEAERLCDRIGILKKGQICVEGSLAELRTLIPAQEIVLIQTPQPNAAIARAQSFGFTHRFYGHELAIWLSQAVTLQEIVTCFEGIPLDAISHQPVRLEHIYLEVMQQQ